MPARVPTFKGAVATFRTPGVALANQPVVTIFNATGSGLKVAVRQIRFVHDRTTNSTNQRFYGISRLTVEPTDGTLLTPIAFDTNDSHHANVQVRGLASADGTNGTLTATAGTTAWRAHGNRLSAAGSLVDQMLYPDHPLLPFSGDPDDPFILEEGHGLLVYEIDAGSTSGHGVFSVAFEEFTYAASGTTVTPGVASLVTATFVPTVSTSNHQLVTPGVASLVTTAFAPTVTPSDHKSVTPTTAALTTATFAPTVTVAAAGVTVTPGVASLTLTTFVPTVALSDNKLVTPGLATLVTATFAPVIKLTVTPSVAALVTTTFAPTVTASAHQTVTPPVAALVLTTFAPNVTGGAGLTVVPGVASLVTATFAPTVTATQHRIVIPSPASVVLTAFAPTVTAPNPQLVTPTTAALALALFAPTVTSGPAIVVGSGFVGVIRDVHDAGLRAVSRDVSSSGRTGAVSGRATARDVTITGTSDDEVS